MTDADSSRKALLTGRFSFCNPALLFARARLYADRLELTGWRLWGRYCQQIPLRRVLKADATSANRLLLWMDDGRTLRVCIGDARRWEEAIASRLGDS